MKPRLNDGPVSLPGVVNEPKKTDEFANIPGTVTTLKVTKDVPIPGTVSQKHGS